MKIVPGWKGLALLVIMGIPARAIETGVPIQIVVTPAIVEQGDEARTTIKTEVILRTPAPCYFICEVRSTDRQKLTFQDIVFKKGDTVGTGKGTIDWSEVTEAATLQVSASSVDAPDKAVSVKVTLEPKSNDAL